MTPTEVLAAVAQALEISAARVYGVATFYSHFALEPRGRHVIRVCDGTACHVRGSTELIDVLRRELELPPGEKTTRKCSSPSIPSAVWAPAAWLR